MRSSRAFTRRQGGDLVLVARNREKLEEIKADLESTYGIAVLTIAMDLSRG